MDKDYLKKLILDLICSSKVESGFVNGRPSYKEAAIIYVELDDDIEDLKYQYLSEYDGYDKEQISNIERDRKRLSNIIEKKIEWLDCYKPQVENYKRYEVQLEALPTERLKDFCISFNRSTARRTLDSSFDFIKRNSTEFSSTI
ncbi:MAG: hypothetical protein U5K72_16085 [Balneolaceae bacterium]|nr:hypothetical protein [Balneolaceae bacterium]